MAVALIQYLSFLTAHSSKADCSRTHVDIDSFLHRTCSISDVYFRNAMCVCVCVCVCACACLCVHVHMHMVMCTDKIIYYIQIIWLV